MHFKLGFVIFPILFIFVNGKEKPKSIVLNEATWTSLLEGEWLVKFYAPWCPACKALNPTWDSIVNWAEDLSINVAEVDVAANPGISGRFMVTALPTIYHVKDGQFRQYQGSRSEQDIVSLVDDKKWQDLEPLAWYRHPTSLHMGFIGFIFKASFLIRDIHETMTAEYGIPTWGSYALFAVATILCGLILGLFLVAFCDYVLTPRPRYIPRPPYQPVTSISRQHQDIDKDSDIVEDDRKPTDADDIIVNKTSSLKKQGDSQARNRSTKPSKTD